MKIKTKILVGAILFSTGAIITDQKVDAAVVASPNTDGTVGFKEKIDASGPVVQPGTETPIFPETGGSSIGPLRIEHVPVLEFGMQDISSMDQTYMALYEKFKVMDATGAPTGAAQDIAHFTQVTDERGGMGQWKLSLASTKFVNTTDATNVLAATHIEFTEAKAYNTNGDKVVETSPFSTKTILKNIDPTVSKPTVIGNEGVLVELQSVVATKTTDGSKTSLVFNSEYAPAAPVAPTTTRNSGISLIVPGSDSKKKDASYKATLTWTLEDTL